MKKLILFLIILAPIFATSQNWQWANQVGGNSAQSHDDGQVVTDGTNFYLYGTFSGPMYLQTDTFLGTNGESDFFIIKYNSNGNELWAKRFGGYNTMNEGETMGAIYDSISSCIYFSGIFYGSMQLDTANLTSDGYGRNFIAKMDLNGTFLWAKKAWTRSSPNYTSDDRGPRLSVQKNGVINIITTVIDTAFFDGLSVIPGGCMAKFDSDGNCFYVRHFFDFATLYNSGGFGVQYLHSDMIISGGFKQTFIIDTATIVSNGEHDMLLARADSNGNIKWIKQFGYGNIDYLASLGIDNSNNLYTVGGFTDSISIDGNKFYNSYSDFIYLKFDENGNFIFGKQANSTAHFINPGTIVTDEEGNSYVAGTFSGQVNFGCYTIVSANANDMFLARYNDSGNCLGIRNFGKSRGGNVVVDDLGNPVVAGTFSNTVTIGSSTFTSNGPFDIYLAKSDAFTAIFGEEKVADNRLVIYANPNAGKCNITIPDEFQHEVNLTLSIFDINGKLIQQLPVQMNENQITLNLEGEPKGICNVTLSNGSKRYSGRIVLE